jgi:CBS-domain-containing membrane protein
LVQHDVRALPVLDDIGKLVGMLSEADLIHRFEIGTEKRLPWWQEALTGASMLAADLAKSHGKKVREVMTSGVIFGLQGYTPLGGRRYAGAKRDQARPNGKRR